MIKTFIILSFISYSSNIVAQYGRDCNIAVIKTINEKYKKLDFKIGKNSKFREHQSSRTGHSTSTLLLGSGKTGTISVNNERINIKCTYINSSSYSLEISIEGETGGLSTNINIFRNQKTNIGEIVQDLKEKSKLKDIKSGYGKTKSKRRNYYQYWVTIR